MSEETSQGDPRLLHETLREIRTDIRSLTGQMRELAVSLGEVRSQWDDRRIETIEKGMAALEVKVGVVDRAVVTMRAKAAAYAGVAGLVGVILGLAKDVLF